MAGEKEATTAVGNPEATSELEIRAIRLMAADGKLPKLGETASSLGVRVPKDIAPDANGDVTAGPRMRTATGRG